MNTRAMWKYNCGKGVSGTPTAYINGVMLDEVPLNSEDWLTLLQSVYDSQYGAQTPAQDWTQHFLN